MIAAMIASAARVAPSSALARRPSPRRERGAEHALRAGLDERRTRKRRYHVGADPPGPGDVERLATAAW